MPGFLFAFLACLLAGIGARDSVTVAQLAVRNGASLALLAVALACGMATSGIAAWGAVELGDLVPGPGRLLFAAIALGFAGGEALLLRTPRAPDEPTHSLIATAFVLFAHQLTDSLRFLIFAIALATLAPIPAGMGGAAGSAAGLAAAWLAGDDLLRPALGRVRRIVGGVLLALAVVLGLHALGRV